MLTFVKIQILDDYEEILIYYYNVPRDYDKNGCRGYSSAHF